MINTGIHRARIQISVLVLVAIIAAAWVFSVKQRSPWIGRVSYFYQSWQPCLAVTFVANWIDETPSELYFGLFLNPPSIEFADLQSRESYASYPPGAFIPIYLQSFVTGERTTLTLVMRYNLLNHLLIAITLSLIALGILTRFGYGTLLIIVMAAVPGILHLFLPGPRFWYQNVFFTDQAVIFPLTLLVLLELLWDQGNRRRWLSWCIWLVIFYGVFTDWLFVFVALVLFVKRWVSEQRVESILKRAWKSAAVLLPVVVAVAAFVVQLLLIGSLGKMVSRFLMRAALSKEGADLIANIDIRSLYWYFRNGYRNDGLIIFVLGAAVLISILVYYALRQKRRLQLRWEVRLLLTPASLFFFPCVLYSLVFFNHALAHDFSMAKFAPFIVLVCFVILPLLIVEFLRDFFNGRGVDRVNEASENDAPGIDARVIRVLVALLVFTSAVYYFYNFYPYRDFMLRTYVPPDSLPGRDYAEFIGRTTTYEDVVFSPDFEIPAGPMQLLALSRKRVYRVDSSREIAAFVEAKIAPERMTRLRVCLFFVGTAGGSWHPLLDGTKAKEVIRDGKNVLVKLDGSSFMKLVQK